MVRRALPIALGLTLLGCGESWSPETLLENLRVIGVRADPAEIKPGEAASLSALVLDPSRPGKPNTVLWIGCDPDPFNLGRSTCSDPVALQDPTALFAAGQLPPGVKFIGLNDQAAYAVSKDLFAPLAVDDPRRLTGTVGQILAIVIGEPTVGVPTQAEIAALVEKVRTKQVQSVISLFRIKVSEATARNTNPIISGFYVAGELQFPGAQVQVTAAEKLTVAVDAPESSFEPFVQDTPTGPVDKVEQLTSAWFSTSGRFNYGRIALRGKIEGIFTAPGSRDNPLDLLPLKRTGIFQVVMRDTRGGQTWMEQPFFVCDPFMAPPVLTAVRSPAVRGDPVVLEGKNLQSVLDVLLGGVPLKQGVVDSMTGNWEGLVPPSLAAGTYRLRLHGKECRRAETDFFVTVP